MHERDLRGSERGGWLAPGAALLVAGGLLAFTLLQRGDPAPTPSPPAPSPSPADEHEVSTDEGIVSFRLEGDAIVVRLQTDAGTTEMGRATLPFIASAPPDGTPSPTGTAMFRMVCGSSNPQEARRYVFGHLSAGDATYDGPEAVGRQASDGLFLFALLPGAPSGPIKVTARDRSSAGFGSGAFDRVIDEGVRQPSGCFVED